VQPPHRIAPRLLPGGDEAVYDGWGNTGFLRAMITGTRIATFLLTLALASGIPAGAHAAVALIYHRFDDVRYPSTNLSLATFRQQLDWLGANGFEVWSASKLVERLGAGEAVPDRVAVIIDGEMYGGQQIGIGDSITLRDLEAGEEACYTIVSPREVDLGLGKISNASPLGKAIVGQSVGQTVEVETPAGKLRYQITERA